MGTKTWDPACQELAKYFLEGDEESVAFSGIAYQRELAAEIQATIEDWIEEQRSRLEPRETGDAWTGGFADNH